MLSELPEMDIRLTTTDRKILQARIDGVSFCEMEYDFAKPYLDKILLSGAAITGASLPQTEFFADVISKEIYIHLLEFGKGELTLEEVLLALRINSTIQITSWDGSKVPHIEFFGNSFNIDYLSKVLNNYMTQRGYLDRKLENYLDGYPQK